jgi:threonine 3-dehydrogenase
MKALVKESAGTSYEYKDVPVPVPRGDELLVRVGKVALCGSDIALYQWNNVAQAIAKVPFTPGHEMVGEVSV